MDDDWEEDDEPFYLPEENDDPEGEESLPFVEYDRPGFAPGTQIG